MRTVCLLGASGSIGTQSLDLFRRDPRSFSLVAASVGRRTEALEAILNEFPSVSFACVLEEADYRKLKQKYPHVSWYFGDDGILDMVRDCPAEIVENALVGFAGLRPSLAALEASRVLALANKESLVVGGDLIRGLLAQGKGKLYPIDSEHVAIAKLFPRVLKDEIESLWITASGGSFRDKTREELADVTPAEALAHPTWSMGAKITIDSATMMNKGFEVIEAKVLFDFPLEKTHILMHRESHVHSLVRKKDGTYVADVSAPDMHGPIAYALYEGNVPFDLVEARSLEEIGPFHFAPFDEKRYLAPDLALQAFQKGGTSRAVLNGANEEAVYAFLEGKISFLQIESLVKQAIEGLPSIQNPSIEEIVRADSEARRYVRDAMKGGR